MAFETTREQLKEQTAELLSKIQESSAFNNAREKFESQPPATQRLLSILAVVFVVLFFLYIPYGYIETADMNLELFEENQVLISGLLKSAKSAKEPSPLPQALPQDMFKGRVESILKDARLVPDQIGEIQPLPDRPAGNLAPKVVQQTGLAVPVKRLNLSQVVSIGHQLQGMGAGTKMMGLEISQSAGQTHYYDVVFRLVQFSLPAVFNDEPADTGGKRGGAKSRAPVIRDEEGDE